LRVAIAGGAIAGCAAAIELSRLGCDVTVFERSLGQLEDRGAGIASSVEHLELLESHDLVDADMPSVVLRPTRIFTVPVAGDKRGRTLWETPLRAVGLNWGVLFANLRKRVPDAYQRGSTVTGVDLRPDGTVLVELQDGRQREFDLVVFADGIASFGRSYLHPTAAPKYVGYVVWRGVVSGDDVPAAMLEHGLEFAVHDGGHCVFYLVPDPGRPGKCLLNWGWYLQVPEPELSGLLTDRYGHTHSTSVPRGRATDAHRSIIHQLARQHLRGVAADAIGATSDPFIQAVYEVDIPTYYRGPVCLLGDANAVARGHGGGGAIKATQQAMTLATSLAGHTSLDDALLAWNTEAQPAGSYLVNLGRVLGRATVTGPPAWHIMDAAAMETWWQDATSNVRVYYVDDAVEPPRQR
jgi:2-polyprenyl-6-methoxyphenol hydroxylase-like FAD-dependent oxidoreductase